MSGDYHSLQKRQGTWLKLPASRGWNWAGRAPYFLWKGPQGPPSLSSLLPSPRWDPGVPGHIPIAGSAAASLLGYGTWCSMERTRGCSQRVVISTLWLREGTLEVQVQTPSSVVYQQCDRKQTAEPLCLCFPIWKVTE